MNRITIENFRKNRLSQEELTEFLKWINTASEAEIARVLTEDMEGFEDEQSVETELRELRVMGELKETLFAKKHRSSIWRKIAATAACLLIPVLIFGNIYFYNKAGSTQDFVATVATNEKRVTTVSLPDGSDIELNSGSEIRYNSSDFRKDVRMIDFEGEGFFRIAKSESAPFKIKSNEVEVTVYGTTFNFKAYKQASEAKLCLIEGSVSLTANKSGETVNLAPMEEATLDYASGKISVRKLEDPTIVTAWTAGKLKFNNADLTDVILDIEEVYGCHLSIDRNLAGEHYTGVIPTDNILVAVSILEKIYNVKITVRE